MINLSTTNLKGDVYGGLTAGIVALPLALAFGVSSGAGPIAGLYGAIFVGFFAALFGGTRTQISGPTGPMTVVMAGILTSSATTGLGYAFAVVVFGGLLQVVFGLLKLGRYIRLIPFSVISGFMSGIGIIIILIQLSQLVGQAPVSNPVNALLGLATLWGNINLSALFIGLITLVIVFFTPKRIDKLMPSQLIALICCTLLVAIAMPKGAIPILGNIPSGLPTFSWPSFKLEQLPSIFANAFILALLGSIDSLLTSLVADNATNTQHDSNRELIGQGIGNVVAGLFAGLPGAGATMRTVVNIKAGGVSPISGIIHAVFLFIIVAGAGSLASYIPHAVLAGILIKVGVDIVDWRSIKRISTTPAADIMIMLTVTLLTVFVDLITAVAAGMIMASILLTKKLSDLQLDHMELIDHADHLVHLPESELEFIQSNLNNLLYCRLKGPLSFAAAKDMAIKYQQQLAHRTVILDFSEVIYIDHSTIRTLEDIVKQTQARKIPISIYCSNGKIAKLIQQQSDKQINIEKLLFNDRLQALKFLTQD